MDNRYVFKFYRNETLNINEDYYINYDPGSVMRYNISNQQFEFGLTDNIIHADITTFPPADWQILEEKGLGKIIEVEVSIRAKA